MHPQRFTLRTDKTRNHLQTQDVHNISEYKGNKDFLSELDVKYCSGKLVINKKLSTGNTANKIFICLFPD
jgi:hypothetical protein